MPSSELTISLAEHKTRLEKIRNQMRKSRIDALYLVNSTRILYTSGFSHISTERPLSLVIPRDGGLFFLAPQLENDHIRAECKLADNVYAYPDYPGKTHPMRIFARILGQRGLGSATIATDAPEGAAGGFGYRGPSLRDLMPRAKFVEGRDLVDRLRLVKSDQEIRLLKESAHWSEIAHDILLDNVKAGVHDALVAVRSSSETLGRMLKKLGQRYVQLRIALSPVVVGFRGQVGPGSAIPHAVYSKDKIRKGDVLVTEAGVEIAGYTSELERTAIVGKPSSRARRYFDAMLKAQDAALTTFRPGSPCSTVDDAARRSVEESGLAEGLRHHTGHGIGLDGHEPPWLDPGDRTIMRKGMVFSCEPGLYVPEYAGFRHSDTIQITGKGMSFITNYPRTLEELTV
ncbi:MAG TPA: Xaa-Pro peptidase family protein [Candidatus Dormibacteraeota bacterium]|jgi:Xaa-Pro aminopeptidase|nr:Xaa-Pro peptidase family protein [Candidatus Dormibacteraeota bacterium]